MKKFVVTTLILTLTLFVFTPGCFAKKNKVGKNGAFVCTNDGDITDLSFDFDPPLLVELPSLPPVSITSVEVLPDDGSELAILNPSGRYNYHAGFLGGEIYGYDGEEPVLYSIFEFGSLSENFNIYDVDNPEIPLDCEEVLTYQVTEQNVNLLFKVMDAVIIDSSGPVAGPLNIKLKIKNSDVLFFKLQ